MSIHSSAVYQSMLLLKSQVSVTVTHGVSVWAWLAGWWYWRAGRLAGHGWRCRVYFSVQL